jgi:hypothetical protein
MNTRELIARQILTHRIRQGESLLQARSFVFNKTGLIIPFNEAQKLKREALILWQDQKN